MGEVAWEREFAQVDRIVAELDLETALASCREAIGDDWDFVVGYVSREVRATLELGIMIRNLLDVAEQRGHLDENVSHWFRSNQTFRSRNLGVSDERDARFMEVALRPPATGLLGGLEIVRQDAEARLFRGDGLRTVNPPPLAKRPSFEVPALPV